VNYQDFLSKSPDHQDIFFPKKHEKLLKKAIMTALDGWQAFHR
jgi:hypothetical protein